MINYNKIETVLVAQRKDGKFLYLECEPATTTPHYIDNPIDATHVKPRHGIDKVHDAPYYFENSTRMRDWLKDCEMIRMEIRTEATTRQIKKFLKVGRLTGRGRMCMSIKIGTLKQIKEFIGDEEIDADWMMEHTSIKFDDFTKTVTIKIDDMDEQEYKWLKEKI